MFLECSLKTCRHFSASCSTKKCTTKKTVRLHWLLLVIIYFPVVFGDRFDARVTRPYNEKHLNFIKIEDISQKQTVNNIYKIYSSVTKVGGVLAGKRNDSGTAELLVTQSGGETLFLSNSL